MKLLKRIKATRQAGSEIKRRAEVFVDIGFRPTMTDRCIFHLDRWRPGEVYARGDERICVMCLCSWNASRYAVVQELGYLPVYDNLNHLGYEPQTLEEIGRRLYPDGFSLRAPGQIIPT